MDKSLSTFIFYDKKEWYTHTRARKNTFNIANFSSLNLFLHNISISFNSKITIKYYYSFSLNKIRSISFNVSLFRTKRSIMPLSRLANNSTGYSSLSQLKRPSLVM